MPSFTVPKASILNSGTLKHPIEMNQEHIKKGMSVKEKETITSNISDKKSKFQDLFWFINDNYDYNSGIAGICMFSLNLNFGNIRVDLFDVDPNSWMRESAIFKSDRSTMSAAIYPASMFYIKSLNNGHYHTCIEQLVSEYKNAAWQNELATCTVKKENDIFTLTIKQTYKKDKPSLSYNFSGVQKQMFEHAIEYSINFGQQLHGMNQIFNR